MTNEEKQILMDYFLQSVFGLWRFCILAGRDVKCTSDTQGKQKKHFVPKPCNLPLFSVYFCSSYLKVVTELYWALLQLISCLVSSPKQKWTTFGFFFPWVLPVCSFWNSLVWGAKLDAFEIVRVLRIEWILLCFPQNSVGFKCQGTIFQLTWRVQCHYCQESLVQSGAHSCALAQMGLGAALVSFFQLHLPFPEFILKSWLISDSLCRGSLESWVFLSPNNPWVVSTTAQTVICVMINTLGQWQAEELYLLKKNNNFGLHHHSGQWGYQDTIIGFETKMS